MNEEDVSKAFENRFRFKMAGKPYTEEIKALCRDFFEAGFLCSSQGESALKSNEREEKFKQEVLAFADKYPLDMLEKFFNYWSEKDRGRKKMRFEKEKTWELPKRLARWASNDKGIVYNGGINNQQRVEAARVGKLASILTTE